MNYKGSANQNIVISSTPHYVVHWQQSSPILSWYAPIALQNGGEGGIRTLDRGYLYSLSRGALSTTQPLLLWIDILHLNFFSCSDYCANVL